MSSGDVPSSASELLARDPRGASSRPTVVERSASGDNDVQVETSPILEAPVLETPRLTLRSHALADLADCVAMWSDPRITRYTIGTPSPAAIAGTAKSRSGMGTTAYGPKNTASTPARMPTRTAVA